MCQFYSRTKKGPDDQGRKKPERQEKKIKKKLGRETKVGTVVSNPGSTVFPVSIKVKSCCMLLRIQEIVGQMLFVHLKKSAMNRIYAFKISTSHR